MSNSAKQAKGQREAAQDTTQWQSHRVTANALRIVVFAGPVSAAVLVGLFVSRSIPGDSARAWTVRLGLAAIASVMAFVVIERLGRRFLPLAFLLRLNLVFPDRAPSRFSVALRSTSVRKLEQWVQEARESNDVSVLAEKVVTLASALNTHDRRTRGHCERTRALADLIAEELRLSPSEANEVRWGAFLHDIGKLVVPADILNKPGKPTTREWEILKGHPEAGARLVEPLRTFLSSGVDAVGSHHENYDGTGYPAGLSGEQLALAARIVSVADSFEVMTAVRAYKRPMTMQAAREELARGSGSQFDPHVVRAFLNVSLGKLHWVLGMAAWMAELPFLSILPRVVAQVSTSAGGGVAISPIGLPGVAAASLGAMAVMGHVESAKIPSVPAPRISAASFHPLTPPSVTNTPSPSGSPTTDPSSGPPATPGVGASLPLPTGVQVHVAGIPLVDENVRLKDTPDVNLGRVVATVSTVGSSQDDVRGPLSVVSNALGDTGATVTTAGDALGSSGVQGVVDGAIQGPAKGATAGDDVKDVLDAIP
jgi:hypothetical protein